MKKILLMAGAMLFVTSCGPAQKTTETAEITKAIEPTETLETSSDIEPEYIGRWRVVITDEIYATCDNGNLLYLYKGYSKGGLAVVPKSPQCNRSTRPTWTAVEP